MHLPIHSRHCKNQGIKLNIAKQQLLRIDDRKSNPEYLLRFARRLKFDTAILLGIVSKCRYRRQKLLHGAWENPLLHPIMFIKLQMAARKLQVQMEDLFMGIYAECGNKEFLEAVAEARFVTPRYIESVKEARRQYLDMIGNFFEVMDEKLHCH